MHQEKDRRIKDWNEKRAWYAYLYMAASGICLFVYILYEAYKQ